MSSFQREPAQHMARYFTLILLLFTLPLIGCEKNHGFGEGHEWVLPRPAAELRLTVLNANQQPLSNAILWLLYGGEKIQVPDRLLDYDPATGLETDAGGRAFIRYLGETGGGFEVPLGAPARPKFELLVEAPSGESRLLDLDAWLFRSHFHSGEVSVLHDGRPVKLIVIEQSISFE
jgi:hypothetical protein